MSEKANILVTGLKSADFNLGPFLRNWTDWKELGRWRQHLFQFAQNKKKIAVPGSTSVRNSHPSSLISVPFQSDDDVPQPFLLLYGLHAIEHYEIRGLCENFLQIGSTV